MLLFGAADIDFIVIFIILTLQVILVYCFTLFSTITSCATKYLRKCFSTSVLPFIIIDSTSLMLFFVFFFYFALFHRSCPPLSISSFLCFHIVAAVAILYYMTSKKENNLYIWVELWRCLLHNKYTPYRENHCSLLLEKIFFFHIFSHWNECMLLKSILVASFWLLRNS